MAGMTGGTAAAGGPAIGGPPPFCHGKVKIGLTVRVAVRPSARPDAGDGRGRYEDAAVGLEGLHDAGQVHALEPREA